MVVLVQFRVSTRCCCSWGRNADPKAAMEAYMKMRGGSGKKNVAPSNDPTGGAFPKEYTNINSTPLSYDVGASSNEFDIVIP